MFELLRETFRINVCIPHHGGSHKRVRHFAGDEGQITNSCVAEVSLPDADPVAILGKRPSCAAVISKGDVGRARAGARLEANAKEPVVDQRAAQAEAQAIACAIALEGVAG